jgi:hypothetical protein
MESKINIAIENLRMAILEEMNEMSEKHRETLRELHESRNQHKKLDEEEGEIIRENAIMEFKQKNIIIDKNTLKLIFKKTCSHFKDETGEAWQNCRVVNCGLKSCKFLVPHSLGSIERDLCFAIWHEKILEK